MCSAYINSQGHLTRQAVFRYMFLAHISSQGHKVEKIKNRTPFSALPVVKSAGDLLLSLPNPQMHSYVSVKETH